MSDQPNTECPNCHAVSYHPKDVEQKYCGRCNAFYVDFVEVIQPPNTRLQIEDCWAFISRDAEGREAVCGSIIGALGSQPLITTNPRILSVMKKLARTMQRETPMEITLVHFSNRKEIKEW